MNSRRPMPRGPGDRAKSAPGWAIPGLSAYLVATRRHQGLRRLDDAAFRRVARGCDVFMLASTAAGLLIAWNLLPSVAGLILLLASSIWGMANLLTLGRSLSAERRRRARHTP